MTKTERKRAAQDRILHAVVSAFYAILDDDDMSDCEKAEAHEDLDKQFGRLEKMYGYVPGSWARR